MIRWCIHMASNEKVCQAVLSAVRPFSAAHRTGLPSFPSPLLVPSICYLGLLVVFCLLGFFVCLFVTALCRPGWSSLPCVSIQSVEITGMYHPPIYMYLFINTYNI